MFDRLTSKAYCMVLCKIIIVTIVVMPGDVQYVDLVTCELSTVTCAFADSCNKFEFCRITHSKRNIQDRLTVTDLSNPR